MVLTNVHDPAITDLVDKPSIPEALNKQREGEASPCANTVSRRLPEKDGNSPARHARYGTGENEEPA